MCNLCVFVMFVFNLYVVFNVPVYLNLPSVVNSGVYVVHFVLSYVFFDPCCDVRCDFCIITIFVVFVFAYT